MTTSYQERTLLQLENNKTTNSTSETTTHSLLIDPPAVPWGPQRDNSCNLIGIKLANLIIVILVVVAML